MLENDLIKQAQEDSINGIKNKICETCWKYESTGVMSLRQHALKQLGDNTDTVLKNFILDTGNVCNLSCRTCNPMLSSGWIKEEAAFRNKHSTIRSIDYDSIIDNHDFSNLSTIRVIGGEPLKNMGHLEVLKKIIRDGKSKDCNLVYTTNATNLPTDHMLDIWSHFKKIDLNLSIDAVGKQFRYIRTDGDWNKVVEFLDYVRAPELEIGLKVNIVFSALNIFYIDELYQWMDDNSLSRYSILIAFHPEHYTFTIFTDDQRQQIIDMLSASKFQNHYQGIISHLNNVQFNQKNLDDFWIRTEFTKTYKGYDAEEYLPKLINFLRT